MIVHSAMSTCVKNLVCLNRSVEAHVGSKLCSVVSRSTQRSCCFCLNPENSKAKYSHLTIPNTLNQTSQVSYATSCFTKQKGKLWSLAVKDSDKTGGNHGAHFKITLASRSMSMRFLVPKQIMPRKIHLTLRPESWPPGSTSAGLVCGLLVCYSSFEPVHGEAARDYYDDDDDDDCDSSRTKLWHGKKVVTDYSITGIPGDGRCLFRSVAHGACLLRGELAPSENRQRELADDLRARVADEFIRRRQETEWFVEGDFDTYVAEMRKPHVWGGEPELFMASHVLKMPITVYMHDSEAGGLISVAEYGQEYGKHNPIRVLYHGFGHYDALLIPSKINHPKSRL